MAGRRETEFLKPIDKALQGGVSEFPGCNESERIGSLDRDLNPGAEVVISN